MKKTLALLSVFSFAVCLGQNPNSRNELANLKEMIFPQSKGESNVTYDCDPIRTTCNFHRNIDFDHPNYDIFNGFDNPFHHGWVTDWLPASGSPQVYDGVHITDPPPPLSNGYAVLGSEYEFPGLVNSEGIAQKIQNLVPGQHYLYSFFKRRMITAGTNFPVNNFSIVLMHCRDFVLPEVGSSIPPKIPQNSTVIYCETQVNNTTWQQVVFGFVPNDDYDMIVIYAAPNIPDQPQNSFAVLNFASPELINIENYSAGATPNPTPGNCNVTIGPDCSVKNAVFTWTGPHNQTQTGQHIDVNTSDPNNVGTWTVTMSVPNTTITNSQCGTLTPAPVAVGSVYVPSCTASSGLWVWMHGDNVTNQPGVYGTQGVPAPGNKPGARKGSATWVDANGDLWLFGGDHVYFDQNNTQQNDEYNDMWKYSVSLNQWVWMKGDNIPNQNGTYGIQNVTASTNKPGARTNATSWVDANGIFWMFGGGNGLYGFPFFNDLWKYDPNPGSPTYNQWTWVSGSNLTNQVGVYGTINIPSTTNMPGGRVNASGWYDSNDGSFWLWGGSGIANGSNSFSVLNDLWRYTGGKWTWMKGDNASTSTAPPIANFGLLNIEATSNTPAGQSSAGITWVDGNSNLWLYGGITYVGGAIPFGYSNALWMFNRGTNNWVWKGGSNTSNSTATYGSIGIPSPNNNPGGRQCSNAWRDPTNGSLWLYGGGALTQYPNDITASDLWKYDPSSGDWTWVSGAAVPNADPVYYGSQGIGSALTTPGGRSNSVGWTGLNNNFWLFGGHGNSQENDLWKYTGACTGPNCRIIQNLSNKFSESRTSTTRVELNPNPVSNILSLSIFTDNLPNFSIFNITITDQFGNVVLRNDQLSTRNLNVSGLKTGVYFISMLNKKGEKASSTFLKL